MAKHPPKPMTFETWVALNLLAAGLAGALVATTLIAFNIIPFLPVCAAQGPWLPHGMVKAGSGPVAQDRASLSLLNPHKGMFI